MLFDRRQQAPYANDFSDSNFCDNRNLKHQVIEKISKFKDDLELLIKQNDGEKQKMFREVL